jgi:hypothetical protein
VEDVSALGHIALLVIRALWIEPELQHPARRGNGAGNHTLLNPFANVANVDEHRRPGVELGLHLFGGQLFDVGFCFGNQVVHGSSRHDPNTTKRARARVDRGTLHT